MPFKTATSKEREQEIKKRSSRGLSYVKGSLETFTPVDGDNAIRIVPPLASDKYASLWGVEIWTYFLANRVYVSSTTFDKHPNDPVAEHFFKVRQTDEQEASKYRGTRRHLMYVMDMNDADNPQLKIWAAPPTLVDEFIGLSKDPRSGKLVPLEDPQQGRVIFFTRTGQGINTKYTRVQLDSEASPLDESLAEELDEFENIIEVASEDELRSAVQKVQNADDDDDDDDEDSRPVAKTASDDEGDETQSGGSTSEDSVRERVRKTLRGRNS